MRANVTTGSEGIGSSKLIERRARTKSSDHGDRLVISKTEAVGIRRRLIIVVLFVVALSACFFVKSFSSSLSSLSIAILSLFQFVAKPAECAWPDTPFTTNGRDIVSASGVNVIYAGVNWPGAADTMLPEGLQYNSIANIVSMIKSLGMNVIRLTYAIEMVDDIESNNPNSTLQNTLINALGSENGNSVFQEILNNNPSFTAETTRLDVFDAVAAECATQQIYVHLDNHMSKAEWCCSLTDGNGWFGDEYFDVYNWQRGLGFMANHAKSWTALASMSLRNELRQPEDTPYNASAEPYDWESWYENAIPAATGIYSNNSLPLIFFSGLNFDTDDSVIVDATDVGNGQSFDPSSYPFANKVVFELHNYVNDATSCDDIDPGLYIGGYSAMNLSDTTYPNKAPVVMTEFGFDQTDGSDEGPYAQCIKDYLTGQPGGPGGWMQWVLAGSYYIRTGTQDSDETWGLLNHDWSAFRNQTVIDEFVTPFVSATLG